jgi:uncharacterized phage-associated protein
MAYDGRALANLLLDQADRQGLRLTNLGVQKVLYNAHGWHLVQFSAPLVAQAFEAWRHGPVLPAVWEAFKQAGDRPIAGRAMRLDPVTREVSIASADFAPHVAGFLSAILRSYGHIDPLVLSRMTHRPGGPWHKVWAAPNGGVTPGMRIADEAIRVDFLDQAAMGVGGTA